MRRFDVCSCYPIGDEPAGRLLERGAFCLIAILGMMTRYSKYTSDAAWVTQPLCRPDSISPTASFPEARVF